MVLGFRAGCCSGNKKGDKVQRRMVSAAVSLVTFLGVIYWIGRARSAAYFSAAMLAFSEAILLSASACFLRSMSMTAAGALLTNFSLLSFLSTL